MKDCESDKIMILYVLDELNSEEAQISPVTHL